uniref:Uncharacterized protein n=1 Tax=Nelumbo nucifera TaxID=4432 RepID=A0A822ZVE3_NELNU|nr:TPA_asm: hypothetical protein HUJ06_004108 [Nelumbo nucifera]
MKIIRKQVQSDFWLAKIKQQFQRFQSNQKTSLIFYVIIRKCLVKKNNIPHELGVCKP